jgi:DNA-binding XRE family transcriptional regulator
MTFATQLKEHRKRLGLNQAECGIILGFSEDAICKFERSECEPKAVTQEGILARLSKMIVKYKARKMNTMKEGTL